MKKCKFFVFCAMLLGVCLMTSCSTKQQAINSLDKFANELRKNSADYTLEDWKHAAEKYQKVNNKILKLDDYTLAEQKEIAKKELDVLIAIKHGLADSVPGIIFNMITDFSSLQEKIEELIQ